MVEDIGNNLFTSDDLFSNAAVAVAVASALAHEINQPLAAINIYSHSCLEQFKKNQITDKLLDGLEQIQALSLHAGEILHKMKNFIREGELCSEMTDINFLIKQALTHLNHQKTKFNVRFVFDESLPLVILDRIKIIQVILNIAQNSIDSAQTIKDQIPEIIITTQRVDDYIEIYFKDNGPGIPSNIVDKITNSYFTTKSRGTGLGLAICRSLIEAHGGILIIKKSEERAWVAFTLPINQKKQTPR